MRRKIMSVVDDIKIHHQFDDGAQVEYKIENESLTIWICSEGQKEVVATFAMPEVSSE